MDVVLPDTGCNILVSSTSFYNYSSDYLTRETYYIYEGVAHKQSTTYNQYGYIVNGDCLSTGDLVYKPEMQVFFPIIQFCLVAFIFILVYKIFIKRLMP